jgi:hypothetical protein
MIKDEFTISINNIIHSGKCCGIGAYVMIKNENNFVLKKLSSLDTLTNKMRELITEVIDEQYLNSEIEFDVISNVADNKRSIYMIEQNESYYPFNVLNSIDTVTDTYEDSDIENMIGYIFKLNLNSKKLYVYQQAYSGTKIKNRNVLHIINAGVDKYGIFDKQLLRIDKRGEIIIIKEKLYIKNISVLQEKFGFDTFIRSEAKSVIESIDKLDLVSDLAKVIACESKERLTTAKKLMKLKNSPVLKMDKNILLTKLKSIDRYKNITIEDGKIRTKTNSDVNNLLKMLNDDYLKSELTDTEYDSSVKKLVSA